jgi:FkbM family methyltransferase
VKEKIFEIEATPRNAFCFGDVQLVARFRRFALRTRIKPLRNLSKFLMKIWCRLLRLPLRGTFGLEYSGTTLWINVETPNSAFETVLTWPHGSYEPVVRVLVDRLLSDDGAFYDIGANWGYYALFVASRPGFKGQVHAFEPYPPTAEDFAMVLAQTPFADRITLYGVALSDREGLANMTLPHRVKRAQAEISMGKEGVEVPTRPLDMLGLPGPQVIKLDVEGHEANVLAGAQETLEKYRPAIVFENWAAPDDIEKTEAPIRLLESLGYRIYAPAFAPIRGNGKGQLMFTRVNAENRADFPDVDDLCALYPEHIDRLLAS